MSQSHSFSRPAPLVNIAAIAVILASLTAIGGVTGLIPSAFSHKADSFVAQGSATMAAETDAQSRAVGRANTGGTSGDICRQCGVVETVRQVHVKGQGTGLGAVAGGVTGAIVGSQFGRGNGRTAMGVVGAAGGAFAGHQIEKNVRTTTSYRVIVRMEDGSARTVYQSAAPAFGVGEKVRVNNGVLAARG
jgi:outer membrane lipoprotein SlyB